MFARFLLDACYGRHVLTEDRRRAIGDLVRERGSVRARELSERFDVSPMTIYRDLVSLEVEQELQRVRGGAVRRTAETEPMYATKRSVHREEKRAIARYAATHFVRDQDIVVIEAGTTVTAMVRFLPNTLAALVANGLEALNEARRLVPAVPVMSCGGQLRSPSFTFVGPEAESFFRSISATTAFLSATGFTLRDGITDPNPLEIEVKQAMAASAQRVVLLLDSSKFGTRSLRQVLSLRDVDVLITDSGASDDVVDGLRKEDLEVHVVDASAGNGSR